MSNLVGYTSFIYCLLFYVSDQQLNTLLDLDFRYLICYIERGYSPLHSSQPFYSVQRKAVGNYEKYCTSETTQWES